MENQVNEQPAPPQVPVQSPQVPLQPVPPTQKKFPIVLIAVVGLIIVCIASTTVFLMNAQNSTKEAAEPTTQTITPTNTPTTVVPTVYSKPQPAGTKASISQEDIQRLEEGLVSQDIAKVNLTLHPMLRASNTTPLLPPNSKLKLFPETFRVTENGSGASIKGEITGAETKKTTILLLPEIDESSEIHWYVFSTSEN